MSKSSIGHRAKALALAIGFAAAGSSAHAAVNFSTFVSASDINALLGQTNTIAFNYAGNKFVGSVYTGGNNLQLFSTDLTGHNVQAFGAPLPSGGGEVVIGASLGQGGFGTGDVYAAPSNSIYKYSNAGGAPTLFGSTDDGSTVRQVFFDPGNGYGGRMIVSTNTGHILTFDAAGNRTLLASVGSDTEGMDIASTNYGQYSGQLLVASETTGGVYAISPTGTVKRLNLLDAAGGQFAISLAETVSTVPLNLGQSGNPLEGFYVANYPVDIQKADATQFTGLLGDTLVTSEFGSNSTLWRLAYNGDAADTFTVTSVGAIPNQSEDGIFVTAQRIRDTQVPEPAELSLIGLALSGLALMSRKRAV